MAKGKGSDKAAARKAARVEAEAFKAAERRREKIRAWSYLALIGAVVLGLLALLVLVPFLKDKATESRLADLKVSDIGTSAAQAGCQPRKTEKVVVPKAGWHVKNGTSLTYADAPPAYGKHWAVPLAEDRYRDFFTARDRPEVALLVHSLEHGHTVLWYDETIAADSTAVADLKTLASRFEDSDGLVIAPWTAEDGAAFPGGAHIALTHWTGPKNQRGVWEYCGGLSGESVKTFFLDYPRDDAPEPGAV